MRTEGTDQLNASSVNNAIFIVNFGKLYRHFRFGTVHGFTTARCGVNRWRPRKNINYHRWPCTSPSSLLCWLTQPLRFSIDDGNCCYPQAPVVWDGITAVLEPRTGTFGLSRSIGFATVKTTVEISELKTKQTVVQVRNYTVSQKCTNV